MNRTRLLIPIIAALACFSCNDNENGTTSASRQDSGTVTAGDTSSTSAATQNTTSNTATLHDAMDRMMKDMHGMKMTGNPDRDFAMMMKSHHNGAIEMSNVELSSGTNAELKQLAQKIIDDSKKDNEDLEAFMSQHQDSGRSDYAKKAMDIMMKMPAGANMDNGSDVDAQFAMMMAKHHQDGIDMSRLYLKSAKAEQTKKVANNVIKSNGDDLKKLKAWKGQNKADTSAHAGH